MVQYSKKFKNATFRKLDLFPSSGQGEKTPSQLGPVERANLLIFLEYWTMDKVQKRTNSECYTPSSEPLESTHPHASFVARI
jgi:hypothetical protein